MRITGKAEQLQAQEECEKLVEENNMATTDPYFLAIFALIRNSLIYSLGDAMLDIPSISATIAAIGVLVGVILALVELRNIARTRQMQLIMGIYSLFTTREYMDAWEKIRTREFKDYDGYAKRHGLIEFMQVAALFEGLGFLLHRRFLNIDLIRELMNESTKMTWEKVRPMIEDARKQFSQRKSGEYVPVYQWWEHLYNELLKREQSLQQEQQ